MSIRLISDVHGKWQNYLDITKDCKYSIQLGDMGFDYGHLIKRDPEKHRFIPGNHDNYDKLVSIPHSLGDFGVTCLNRLTFFYMRGEFSIDKSRRTIGIDWWSQEELSVEKMSDAYFLYEDVCPDIVLAHSCPAEIGRQIGNPQDLVNFRFNPETFTTRTQSCFQDMFDIHKPKLWIFGHWHKNIDIDVLGTRFVCMEELGYLDINCYGTPVGQAKSSTGSDFRKVWNYESNS